MWGDLPKDTNNIAETLSLYVGLKLTKERGINSLMVMRDSMMIIKGMIKGGKEETTPLDKIMKRVTQITQYFTFINYLLQMLNLNSKLG